MQYTVQCKAQLGLPVLKHQRSCSLLPDQTNARATCAPPCQPTGAWLSISRSPSSSTKARVVWQPGGTSSAIHRTSSSMQASVSCGNTGPVRKP